MAQLRVIDGGDFAASAILYKPHTQDTLHYFSQNLENVYNKLGNINSSFVSTVQNMYNSNYGEEAQRATQIILNKANSVLSHDHITAIPYEYIPIASTYMQEFVMSQPDISKLHQKQCCYGYQDSYIDMEPGVYGKDRITYQNVMDGVLQFEENEEELGYINHYSNGSDQELTSIEKMSVLDLWEDVKLYMAKGIDPTDPLSKSN